MYCTGVRLNSPRSCSATRRLFTPPLRAPDRDACTQAVLWQTEKQEGARALADVTAKASSYEGQLRQQMEGMQRQQQHADQLITTLKAKEEELQSMRREAAQFTEQVRGFGSDWFTLVHGAGEGSS